MIHSGQCHCGKLKASFETQKALQALGVRACQCDFCRRVGAVNVCDPSGAVTIDGAPADVARYRFALKTADFLICKLCGVYIAAAMGDGARIVSTINIAGLRMKDFLAFDETPMEYGGEATQDRVARRFAKWTPTRFSDPELAASYFGPH